MSFQHTTRTGTVSIVGKSRARQLLAAGITNVDEVMAQMKEKPDAKIPLRDGGTMQWVAKK